MQLYQSIARESNGFRIFELLPGFNASPAEIRGNLHEARLSNSPKYEALSYCWGDPTVKHSIQINGKPLPVTHSLYYALHHLRQPNESRYLWIDAICINQQDLDERSQQVGLMRQIYNQASHVVVWLGPEADNSRAGMSLTENLCRAYHQRASTGDLRQYQHLQDGGLSAVYNLPAYRDGPDFVAFFKLFDRAWFGRGWVIQEVASAKTVTIQCGTCTLNFEDLMLGIIFLSDMDMTPLTGQAMRIGLTRQAFQHGQGQSLLMLLTRHSVVQTTDPRDRIYAFSGMALDTQMTENRPERGFAANYRADVEDVYRSVVIYVITKTRCLDILFAPREPNNISKLSLPSWVPDFSLSYQQRFLLPPNATVPNPTTAPANTPPLATLTTVSPTPGTNSKPHHLLHISGNIFDTITALTDTWPFSTQDDNDTHTILSAFRSALQDHRLTIQTHQVAGLDRWPWTVRPTRHPNGQRLEEAVWAACIAGSTSNSSTRSHKAAFRDFRGKFRAAGLLRLVPSSSLQTVVLVIGFLLQSLGLGLCLCCCLCCIPGFFAREERGDWMSLATGLGGRRLLRTRRGWVGVTGGSPRVGDQVAVVEGGRLVAVLRDEGSEVSEGGREIVVAGRGTGERRLWRLVGDAYVHGAAEERTGERRRGGTIWLC